LLRESGFEKVEVTGRSGDGGIDGQGILQLNAFVSFRVLFQCKRYAGGVGPDKIRDFRGAMVGRADKGIILTTGGFTASATQEASRDGASPIELVDGHELVQLLEQLELGVRKVQAFDIDEAFFKGFDE
jgi:restriction system protein